MPREFASLLFAVWTVPFAAGTYIVTFDIVWAATGWNAMWVPASVAGAVAWMVLALGLATGFRRIVVPTPRRLVWALLTGVGLALLGGAATVWAYWLTYNEYHAADIARYASWLIPLLWAGAQIAIWREPDSDRMRRMAGLGAYRVACPGCGYDMSGNTAASCPECGRQYTLAQLIVLQPGERVHNVRSVTNSVAARTAQVEIGSESPQENQAGAQPKST